MSTAAANKGNGMTSMPPPLQVHTSQRATLYNSDCSRLPWMQVALAIQLLLAVGLTIFFILYTAGAIPLENFTGSVGPGTTIFCASIVSITSGILFYLSMKK